MKNFEDYISGDNVYGNDMNFDQISLWHEQEKEGFYNISNSVSGDCKKYIDEYSELNKRYAYQFISGMTFQTGIAFGCADGQDISPIAGNIGHILAIEPGSKWKDKTVLAGKATYISPNVNGDIPCADQSIDIICCLSALHHVPNVSYIISEFSRVLKKGGIFILREPICTMGDWRYPRKGLTKNERGFPLPWLDNEIRKNSFEIVKRNICLFPLMGKILRIFGVKRPYNNALYTYLDGILSQMFAWNIRYHRDTVFKKMAPSCVFYLLKKT